jgi:hypothetical protein
LIARSEEGYSMLDHAIDSEATTVAKILGVFKEIV